MKFLNRLDITTEVISSDFYMKNIDLYRMSIKNMIKEIGKQGKDDECLKCLNILGQEIESIDTLNYEYKHLGKTLSFDCLSRGERVLLVSYASKITNTPIILYNDIMQLTKTTLRSFYNLFGNCDNITIVYKNDSELNYLELAMQGEI